MSKATDPRGAGPFGGIVWNEHLASSGQAKGKLRYDLSQNGYVVFDYYRRSAYNNQSIINVLKQTISPSPLPRKTTACKSARPCKEPCGAQAHDLTGFCIIAHTLLGTRSLVCQLYAGAPASPAHCGPNSIRCTMHYYKPHARGLSYLQYSASHAIPRSTTQITSAMRDDQWTKGQPLERRPTGGHDHKMRM